MHLDSDCRVNQDQPDQGEYVCMSVTDSGVGMDEETRRKIFDPFFTTKPVGKGTGLGMAMIYGLVKDHGGFIDVSSEVGKGTTIRIYFPLAREVATASSEDEAVELRGGCETILLAEDEEPIRRALQCILERYGYRVLLAQDGLDALNLYRSHDAKIDLVITDVVMPKMSGPALHREISNGGEGPAFLFASGYAARDVAAYHKLDPTVPLIQKPWSTREFVSRIRAPSTTTSTNIHTPSRVGDSSPPSASDDAESKSVGSSQAAIKANNPASRAIRNMRNLQSYEKRKPRILTA